MDGLIYMITELTSLPSAKHALLHTPSWYKCDIQSYDLGVN